jgi:hypothetical protein
MKTRDEVPEYDDEVLREVRRIKEELAAKHDFDIRRMGEELRRNQETSKKNGWVFVDPPQKDTKE